MNTGETFILFNKQIKGNKRELVQLGVPIFGHARDENTTDSNNSGKESLWSTGLSLNGLTQVVETSVGLQLT